LPNQPTKPTLSSSQDKPIRTPGTPEQAKGETEEGEGVDNDVVSGRIRWGCTFNKGV
jgi:hypothetical protein